MIRFNIPFFRLMSRLGLSERSLAQKTGLSRSLIRSIFSKQNVTLKSLEGVATFFGCELHIFASQKEISSICSTIATALLVERDGFDSWKIHFFNLVDEFRRSLDARLVLLPPHESFDAKLSALLASIVRDLTEEASMDTPSWAMKRKPLEKPWFVAEMNNLKASALLESPFPYRANNIFVHENFLDRV